MHGYVATGMDRPTEASDMSSRALYKHARSKAQLMVAALNERPLGSCGASMYKAWIFSSPRRKTGSASKALGDACFFAPGPRPAARRRDQQGREGT